MNRQTRMLPAELEKQVRKTLEEWAVAGKVRQLWARDATLWTGADEASWLGWLEIAGAGRAGGQFIDITDPGSRLQGMAEADRFRRVFLGEPSIGGRYSALSNFGMVPAAIMGLDVARFLERAEEMAEACAASVPVEKNPGAVLGVTLGVLATHGRDKVTLIVSPAIYDLGAWREPLLAESTGKEGKGLIPVDREPLGPPEVYGADRLFVYLRLASAPDEHQDPAV